MPLPDTNTILTIPNLTGLPPDALWNHPIVMKGNEDHGARMGNLTWAAPRMTVTNGFPINCWYIPAVVNKVSYCVVPRGAGGDAYVISDQYGGCEYHELYNASFSKLAFLHVYRGDGKVTKYKPAAGWVVRTMKRSSVIAQRGGMSVSNWSVSYIQWNVTPPVVQSKFIAVRDSFQWGLKVVDEDDGDTPYPRR